MDRLLSALKQYSMLKMKPLQSADYNEELTRFMNDVYTEMMNDYIHFQEHHEHQLEQINEELIKSNAFNECDITKCEYTQRHHQTAKAKRMMMNTDQMDPKVHLYEETLDALHFHLFHCFDVGLRMRKMNDNEDQIEDEQKQNNDRYYDHTLARMDKTILERHHVTAQFDRFSTQNAKYNIATTSDKQQSNNRTYLDQIIIHLIKQRFDDVDIKKVVQFINDEQYDTDAVRDDHAVPPNGNILIACMTNENESLLNEWRVFINDTKLQASSFSVGFRFYYWIFYKDKKDITQQIYGNVWDHAGYDICELFIEAKYSSFKEEIRHYEHVSLKQYQKVTVKVNHYLDAKVIKQTTATEYGTRDTSYDIYEGDPILFDHLCALVLYTDYSDHSSAFSATFRKKNGFETIASVKKRNQSYYWMSRRLRECVEIFGQCRDYGGLSGPFYCGMSGVLHVASFNIRLCAPTSTSKQIEVAMKFSGQNGIVLQMDNPRSYQYVWLHGFNASWISRYKAEDERVFVGGLWLLKIQSIRIRATKQNFETFVACLYYLDVMLTGGDIYDLPWDMKLTHDDIFIIKCLINNALNPQQEKKSFDNYIHSTFAAFIRGKKQIVFSLHDLINAHQEIRDLFMNEIKKEDEMGELEDNKLCNLFKPKLFKIFKNAKSIVIDCDAYYTLSMIGLLSLVECCHLDKVIIKAYAMHAMEGNNWIDDLWLNSAPTLIQQYDDLNYSISYQKVSHKDAEWSQFVIAKR
eukprot:155223_1